MSSRVLVIEDDEDINKLITMNLSDMNYEVDSCGNGRVGFEKAKMGEYDAIVLDVMLPEMDGLEICHRLRAEQNLAPILMLTARDHEADRVIGLEMGADDYLTKPFSVRELQARVKALLRRVEMLTAQKEVHENTDHLQFKDLEIQVSRHKVSLKGKPVDLTTTEFDLLVYMARQPGVAFSRSELLDKVWGYHHSGYEHTVNSHINRLRTKLEVDPANPEYVMTIWGVGYKFIDQEGAD